MSQSARVCAMLPGTFALTLCLTAPQEHKESPEISTNVLSHIHMQPWTLNMYTCERIFGVELI
jgi:hypothetical protein